MMVVTSNEVPGFEIGAVYGEVFGLTVRAMTIGTTFSAGLRAMSGGEIPEMSRLLAESRNQAMARMVEQAKARGGNAIVAMRFDTGSFQQWTEVCAYGTAVWVTPVSDFAKANFKKLVD
ncbi:UPF0145 protein [Rhizocola hellebori]|uniref:UPF0145 protein Rhe02_01680 n=1 Tax=Rhizocola hellebori TaxID=1392758 RepID=A0A8J3Q1W3_9ACTN|nr:YbjQ family protein [Rhizocola hellebori]GIH02101.1 UPF0145 protein [Rhizocola hellebori]